MVYRLSLLSCFILFLVAISCIVNAQQGSLDVAQNSVQVAYQVIVEANNAGVDTTTLVEQLNHALNLTAQAQKIAMTDPQQADTLAIEAQAVVQNVTDQALTAKQSATVVPVISIVAISGLLAVGVITYALGPKLLWKLWFKLRRNNRVVFKGSQVNDKATVITAKQVCAVVLGLTLVTAFLVGSQVFLPKTRGEQFSELGVLGPNMKLGDYPSHVVASETVHLYIYVGNQMGEPMFYTVMVKLGDNNTQTNPANLTAIRQNQQILANNQTWTYPIDVTLTSPGVNQRLIFELWAYNQTTNQLEYNQRWGQIWLNVTAPAT